jgi:hypothetical protein
MKSKLIVAMIAMLVIAAQIAPAFAGDPSQWLR